MTFSEDFGINRSNIRYLVLAAVNALIIVLIIFYEPDTHVHLFPTLLDRLDPGGLFGLKCGWIIFFCGLLFVIFTTILLFRYIHYLQSKTYKILMGIGTAGFLGVSAYAGIYSLTMLYFIFINSFATFVSDPELLAITCKDYDVIATRVNNSGRLQYYCPFGYGPFPRIGTLEKIPDFIYVELSNKAIAEQSKLNPAWDVQKSLMIREKLRLRYGVDWDDNAKK